MHDNRTFDWDSGESSRTMLPAYATISRAWQYAIERQTFYSIVLRSTELGDFCQFLVNHRRKLLKRLKFEVILPAYTDKAYAKFETETDKHSNNKVFTKAIRDLLILFLSGHDESHGASKHGDSLREHSLRLSIRSCYSPMDFDCIGWGKRNLERPHDLLKHRYESSLLRLDSIEDIQQISQVTALHTS